MTVSLLHSHHVPPLEPPPRKAPLPPALLLPTPLLPALLPATTAAAAATGSWRWHERAYSSSPRALTSLRVHHHRAQLVLHRDRIGGGGPFRCCRRPPSPPTTVVVAPSRYVASLESKSIASPTSQIVVIAAAATASTGSARCRGRTPKCCCTEDVGGRKNIEAMHKFSTIGMLLLLNI